MSSLFVWWEMATAKSGSPLIPATFPFPDGADTSRSILLENKYFFFR